MRKGVCSMFRSVPKTTLVVSKRSRRIGDLGKLLVWFQAMTAAPMHTGGGLSPGKTDPGLARIASRRNAELESLAANRGDYLHSIPAAINQARIDLETAQCDLDRCEAVLEAYRDEYKKTHRGLDPASTVTCA